MNQNINSKRVNSNSPGDDLVILSSPKKFTYDSLLPGHKIILQDSIDQIIKVLETIITFI
jgi:hypothetical protein